MIKHKGLGRGLDALLGADTAQPAVAEAAAGPQQTVALSRLQPGRYQPRTRMDESSLQELAASIQRHGMMQPIVVRALASDGSASGSLKSAGSRYEIIAGERRFRAATLAGLAEVPVLVMDVPDESALAMALIENIQREDLNPLEEAQAIKRLLDEFGYTHEKASEAIGRSRSATSNLLRLLNLADPVQTMLLAGDLDMGHARALLAVDRATQTMLANELVQKRLSVRETERLVAKRVATHYNPTLGRKASGNATSAPPDRDMARLRERICEALGTEVRIDSNAKGGGKLVITFASHEQFEGLLARLGVSLERQ